MNTDQIKAELDGIFLQERDPLRLAQYELADITDAIGILRDLAARWDDGEITEEEFGLNAALNNIHSRLRRLGDSLFEIDANLIDTRQLCMALDQQVAEGGSQ